MGHANEKQPPPTEGDLIVYPFLLQDLGDRVDMGKAKHGTYLRTNNGRDALVDAYQEAIDLLFYLKQALMEREGK